MKEIERGYTAEEMRSGLSREVTPEQRDLRERRETTRGESQRGTAGAKALGWE